MIEAASAIAVDIAAGSQASTLASQSTALSPTVFDVASFENTFAAVKAGVTAAPVHGASGAESSGFRSVLSSLNSLNGRAESLDGIAKMYASNKGEMTPGDMVQLTVKTHEFLFQCELTSNVSNRSAEGVQQLFRQQS